MKDREYRINNAGDDRCNERRGIAVKIIFLDLRHGYGSGYGDWYSGDDGAL